MSLRPSIAAIAAATVIAAIGGFFCGRNTAPTKVIEKAKTAEVAAKEKASASVQTDSAVQRDAARWIVHEVRRPDGTMERTATSETVRSSEAASERKEAKREAEIKYVHVDRYVVQEAARPSWGIAARAGLRAGPGGYVYGAEVSRRLLSSLWLGAYATTAKEVGVTLRWEF